MRGTAGIQRSTPGLRANSTRQPDAGVIPIGGTHMIKRLIVSAGLLMGLSGCATYDYVGGSSGGYYHGSPSTQYNYPYGYPSGSGYGYGSGYYGYGSYGYPVYRPYYRPQPPYHGNGHRPPGHGNGHNHNGNRPPRPGNDGGRPPRPGNGDGRPPRPPPANNGGGGKSPWRDLDRLQRPQPRADNAPMQRAMPRPQAMAAPRPAIQDRPAAPRQPSQVRNSQGVRTFER